MTKRNKIIYWIATLWLSLGMVSTGIVQLMKTPEEIQLMTGLGYPVYFLTIIGVWKLLGVVTVLLPAGRQAFLNVMREWAYAGFFFNMSGAIFSHLFSESSATDYIGPVLLLVLTILSWYFRPAERKLVPINQ